MKYACRLVCSALISLAFATSAALAKPSAELTEGIRLIAEGKYSDALTVLQKGHYDATQAAEAHYYKGQALARLHRTAEAEREFKLAKIMDTSGKIAPLADAALAKPAPTNTPSWMPGGSTTTSTPRDSSAAVKECAKRILIQSSERIERVWSDEYIPPIRKSYAHSMPVPTDYPTDSFSPYRPIRVCGTGPRPICHRPGGFDPNRYQFHPGKPAYSLHDPQYKHLSHKATNVAQSAEGLVNLLTREDNGKGVFLVPEGTNLYVRNYEYGAPIDPPPPVGLKTDVPMLSLPKPLKTISSSKI